MTINPNNIKIGDLQYPKYKKWPVTVCYDSWKGYDPDAYHIIVEIVETFNSRWNGKSWAGIMNGENSGRRFREKFATHKAAEEWAENIIKKNFPKKTHKIKIRDNT